MKEKGDSGVTSIFPSDPKKLKAKISRFRSALKADMHDGSGKRFVIGSMCMVLGDLQAAVEYFKWYEKSFPDAGVEPYCTLTWALCLFRAGNKVKAAIKLREATFSNLYIVPYVLGENPQRLSIWHGSNWEDVDYALDLPEELLNLWDADAKSWASGVYFSPAVIRERERYIELGGQLNSLEPGPARSALVSEMFEIQRVKPLLVVE